MVKGSAGSPTACRQMPSRICRSVRQTPAPPTRMMTSVGLSIFGSGTSIILTGWLYPTTWIAFIVYASSSSYVTVLPCCVALDGFFTERVGIHINAVGDAIERGTQYGVERAIEADRAGRAQNLGYRFRCERLAFRRREERSCCRHVQPRRRAL